LTGKGAAVDDLDELLRIADAPSNARTRSQLDLSIQVARSQAEDSKETSRTPAALLNQLDKSITKTVCLLRKLEGYPKWRDICGRQYTSGDGIAVAVSPKELFEGKLTLPRNPPPRKRGWLAVPELGPDGKAIMVNVRAALDDVQKEVRRAAEPRRKRGQPEKWDKSVCIDYAINFFETFSRHKISAHPNGRFAKFCEAFYGAVTDTVPETESLAWYIRERIRNPHKHKRVLSLKK
jgi:hypothetical protein